MSKDRQEKDRLTEYEQRQIELYRLFRDIKLDLNIDTQDPNTDYIINVGCGSSPDQYSLQALAGEFFLTQTGPYLPVIAIDVNPLQIEFAQKNVKPKDKVELRTGDATKLVPLVVEEKGQRPTIVIARNIDAFFDASTIPDLPEQFKTSWRDVFKAVYQSTNEDGIFIVTYKNQQEWIPLTDYFIQAGFTPIGINRENPQGCTTLIRSTLDSWRHRLNLDVIKSDQFVIVGVKEGNTTVEERIQAKRDFYSNIPGSLKNPTD